MINKYNRMLLPLFFIIDLGLITAAFLFSYFLKFGEFMLDKAYVNLLIWVLLVWTCASFFLQTYAEKHAKPLKWHLNKLITAQLIMLFGLFFYITVIKGHFVSRIFLGSFLVLQFVVIVITHIIRHEVVIGYRRKGRNFKKMLVIGELAENDDLIKWSQNNPEYGYRIENCIHYKGPQHDYADLLRQALKKGAYDQLLVLSPASLGNQIKPVIDVAEDHGLRVLIVPQYLITLSNRIVIDYLDSRPVMSLRHEPLRFLHNRILKRSFDLLFSIGVLAIFYWWMHLIVGALIKMTTKGPVLFKQKRIGMNGEEFICYKFRTMRQSETSEKLACDGFGEITDEEDDRITTIGKFLRKYNLDELPQFINVLKGNMSVVGPRPHMLQEDLEVREKVPKYRMRQFIKPGITGWAAVNGYRGGTKDMELMKKRVEHDLYYLERWSFWLDIKIILLTIWQMVTFRTGGK
ncbi:MAG: exopolysaccharide biosynthesis polyprenyl glycosylphosphotransferase [Fidelibacterota bacterium]